MGKKNYIAALLATVMISGCSYMPKKEYVKDVLKETVKVTIDSIVDNSPTIKSDEMYMDTHSHIKNLDYYQNGIEDII
ncbi:MAG: hypothetical protein KKA79_03955, partial [Nanoarchaeota archaeon]|nr:hypothetical protein [Nanoarchaeota archaeon]